MKELITILFIVCFIVGCAEFQSKMDIMKSEQVTCAEEEQSLCAGWKI